jgi:hypothetical protein
MRLVLKRLIQLIVSSFIVSQASYAEILKLGYFDEKKFHVDIDRVDTYESVFLIKQTAQSLTDENRFGELVPSIASHWVISKDRLRYTFFVRKGIKFHDGTDLTASDVVFSLSVIRDSKSNPLSPYLQNISKIQIVDKYRLEIHLKNPSSSLLRVLSSGLAPIFSESSYLDNSKIVTTGSYVLRKNQDGWFLLPNKHYIGNYPPGTTKFKILTNSQLTTPADVVAFGHSKLSRPQQYKHVEVNSFVTYNFMLNPRQTEWKDRNSRLSLIRILLDVKEHLKNDRSFDLRDILPRGMVAHDAIASAYQALLRELDSSVLPPLKGKSIIIASFGPIPFFEKAASFVKKKYDVTLINRVFDGDNFLDKLVKSKDIDGYSIGWASIFSHPDAAFIPFYRLGLESFSPEIYRVKGQASDREELFEQFFLYRKLSRLLIEGGYILPQSQAKTVLMVSPSLTTFNSSYRYTVNLSEVQRQRMEK